MCCSLEKGIQEESQKLKSQHISSTTQMSSQQVVKCRLLRLKTSDNYVTLLLCVYEEIHLQ